MKHKREEELLELIRREGEALEIPESLKPEEMQRILGMEGPGQIQENRKHVQGMGAELQGDQEQRTVQSQTEEQGQKPGMKMQGQKPGKEMQGQKPGEEMQGKEAPAPGTKKELSGKEWSRNRGRSRGKSLSKFLGAAASICLVLGGTANLWQQGFLQQAASLAGVGSPAGERALEQGLSGGFLDAGEQKEKLEESLFAPAIDVPSRTYEEIYAAMREAWERDGRFVYKTMGIEDTARGNAASPLQKESMESMESAAKVEDLADAAFGSTNIQTAGVDEGDRVKNDGRYLYQAVWKEEKGEIRQQVQILDTREGLKELCRLDGFTDIQALYVWEDLLVVIQQKFYVDPAMKDDPYMIVCGDMAWKGEGYQEISFYDIKDRSHPRELKTFTLQGYYGSSRIADGYFYSFSHYSAIPGEDPGDYASYIPRVEGRLLQEKEIIMPEGSKGTSYLVMVSVDLKNPEEFVQTTALVCGSDLFYVSSDSIYVAESLELDRETGWNQDQTQLTRFSYGNGHFILQARGLLPGRLDDSFSLDAQEGYLRAVSTVREYRLEDIIDDRTGQVAGQELKEENQSNALYVLDENLEIVGQVEGLARDEQIYAARFLGDTGYFVTFRQTDPLFAVDLKDPRNPKVLGELKVSGFSDYLHFYGEDRLLGIGMEADEETGRQQGMKLSMFDISDPANVKEIARKDLKDYNYSEALYDHHQILIDPKENLFGFSAEGSSRGKYWKNYLVFTYEEESFLQELCVENETENYYRGIRGTFIGDVFYVLYEDGRVKSFDRENWRLIQELSSSEEQE